MEQGAFSDSFAEKRRRKMRGETGCLLRFEVKIFCVGLRSGRDSMH